MEKIEYFWAKVDENLARADAQANVSGYYLALALAYRMLASSEEKFLNQRPRSAALPKTSVFSTVKQSAPA